MTTLPAEGQSFGRYRLLRRLGHGGMGVVHAAHDPTLNREVAIKVVTPHLAGDPEFRARFQREAELLARLDSPRAVRIFDHGEQDGMLFLVTQLIEGGDLAALVRQHGELAPARALSVVSQVLEGLVDAHAVGIVHRDVKPANVLLRERGRLLEAFLCDFGIATTPGAELSRTGTVAGSLPYMAPERHQGRDPGPAGDVYSAGCLLWFALTGAAPYVGTDVEVAMAHLQAPLPELPGRDRFSRGVNAVLTRSMAKESSRRYPSATAMLAAVRELAAEAPDAVTLPGATAIRRAVPLVPPRRRWTPAVAAVVAVLTVVGASVGVRALADRDLEDTARAGDPVLTGRATGVRHTLLPLPGESHRGSGAPGVRSGAPVVVPSSAPGTGPLEDRQSQAPPVVQTDGPRGTTTVTRTTTPESPQPVDQYRCWNGATVVTYGECSAPHGIAGAGWVFGDMTRYRWSAYDVPGSTSEVEAWIYRYTGPSGNRVFVTVARWGTLADLKARYRTWFDHHTDNALTRSGEYLGRAWKGPKGAYNRSLRFYTGKLWSIAINAETHDDRSDALSRFTRFRLPSVFNGEKL